MRLTYENIERMFREEISKYDFPCPIEVHDYIPEDKGSSGFSFTGYKAIGMTHTKPSLKKKIPDQLVKVTFYPHSLIYNTRVSLEESQVPKFMHGLLMMLATQLGLGISEKVIQFNVSTTVAHEYRHCMQFQYMIENGLDMASYTKDESWSLYGYGLLESDAIAFAEGKVAPIESVFANKKYYKKDWTWFDAMLL
jgi:hypothetical protein